LAERGRAAVFRREFGQENVSKHSKEAELANIKQSQKRHRQSEKARMRNKPVRTRVKNSMKEVRSAIQAKNKEQAQQALQRANSVLDRAASKGVIHRRKATRRISRLSRKVNALE